MLSKVENCFDKRSPMYCLYDYLGGENHQNRRRRGGDNCGAREWNHCRRTGRIFRLIERQEFRAKTKRN